MATPILSEPHIIHASPAHVTQFNAWVRKGALELTPAACVKHYRVLNWYQVARSLLNAIEFQDYYQAYTAALDKHYAAGHKLYAEFANGDIASRDYVAQELAMFDALKLAEAMAFCAAANRSK